MLANKGVPQAVVDGFQSSRGHIGDRLVEAMRAGLSAGGEAGPLHSAGMMIVDKVAWSVADLRCDWTDGCPIENIAAAWEIYRRQLEAYVQRALDPREAPSYGVLGGRVARGSAHTDVVPVDGQIWTYDSFALGIEEDRVHGRGTTDMKEFLACALACAERAKDHPLKAPLSLSISYDEEIGSVGIKEMMPELKPLIGTPRLVIVGEPTGMQVAIGHKGKTALDVTCFGEASHSALAPDFVNAIHVAAEFVNQIRHLQPTLAQGSMDGVYSIPYSTVHIGQIEGGRALNIEPAECVLKMEFRHLSEAPAPQLLSEIEGIAKRVSNSFPNAKPITVNQINAYPRLNTDPANSAVTLAFELADGASATKVSFGTEAGFFAELGLSTVVIGPDDMA